MAEAYSTPVTMHDCNGSVQFATAIHLSCHLANAAVQESVRAYYLGWYSDLVERSPEVVDGFAAPPAGPGHGMKLRPGRLEEPGTSVRVSGEASGTTASARTEG